MEKSVTPSLMARIPMNFISQSVGAISPPDNTDSSRP